MAASRLYGRGGRLGPRPPVFDQSLQIGLEPGAVLTGMLQQQLDQSPLSGPEMPVHAPARQPVQHRDRLLGEQLFKFVGGHRTPVIGDG